MKSLGLFCGAVAVLLGSATPPPLERPAEASAKAVAAPVLPEPVDALELLALEPVPWPAVPPQTAVPKVAAAKPTWTPPPAGAVRVVVSIPHQKAFVFRGGKLVASSPVSTGKRGHETPVGTFRILQKAVHHRSNIYANAPMPYMQKLTHYGVALHAGHLPGYPASHGCIRLPWGFARKLYGMTDGSTRVTVTRAKPKWVGGKPVFG